MSHYSQRGARKVKISIPENFPQWHANKLQTMTNLECSIHSENDNPYIDCGEETYVMLIRGRDINMMFDDGKLVPQLQNLNARTDCPILLIEGWLHSKEEATSHAARQAHGFITHLSMFTNVRVLRAFDGFETLNILQLLAKQNQYGSRNLGIELDGNYSQKQGAVAC